MIIRDIHSDEMEEALDLIWRVFLEFEAPDYTEEGIQEFKRSIDNKEWVLEREYYGAFDENNKLLGVIATKDLTHISLFFVEGKYHGQGIGRKLYEKIKSLNPESFFTVYSSPFAHEIYKHIGFVDTAGEQVVNGLRFFPMRIDY